MLSHSEISLGYILKRCAAYKCKDRQKLGKKIISLHPEAKSQKISYALNSDFLEFLRQQQFFLTNESENHSVSTSSPSKCMKSFPLTCEIGKKETL